MLKGLHAHYTCYVYAITQYDKYTFLIVNI